MKLEQEEEQRMIMRGRGHRMDRDCLQPRSTSAHWTLNLAIVTRVTPGSIGTRRWGHVYNFGGVGVEGTETIS